MSVLAIPITGVSPGGPVPGASCYLNLKLYFHTPLILFKFAKHGKFLKNFVNVTLDTTFEKQ